MPNYHYSKNVINCNYKLPLQHRCGRAVSHCHWLIREVLPIPISSYSILGDNICMLACDHDNVTVFPIFPPCVGQVLISKLKHSRRKDRTARNSADQDLEDAPPPPPLPPRTTDMFIPATVSSTSTAGTESTTVENVIITDSVFGDDGTTGTPTNALCHIFSFTSITENENIGLAPPIPPRTNEMYYVGE